MTFLRKLLVVFVNLSLVWATIPDVALALPVPGRAPHAFQEVYAPVAARDLDALVAPIALYPDALVAQILGAATYPDQVVDADAYVKANPNLTGDALVNSVDEKQWDPSVMALMQFASVLDKLANNLPWTSALGDAAANQQAEVAAAVQRMRAKAYSAGNLKSGEQIKVVQQSPDVIVIQPANPQVVYVPTYNPTVVYGTPVTTPGYTTGDVVAASIISFSVGIAVGAAIGGSSCGWHYSSWGMHWSTRSVYCGGGMYYGNPYWWADTIQATIPDIGLLIIRRHDRRARRRLDGVLRQVECVRGPRHYRSLFRAGPAGLVRCLFNRVDQIDRQRCRFSPADQIVLQRNRLDPGDRQHCLHRHQRILATEIDQVEEDPRRDRLPALRVRSLIRANFADIRQQPNRSRQSSRMRFQARVVAGRRAHAETKACRLQRPGPPHLLHDQQVVGRAGDSEWIPMAWHDK